jgi:drug/metabolite transporter (DMT)-like permease
VLFFRMLFALPFVLPWLARGGIAVLRTRRLGGHLLRGLVGIASMWCWVYAVSGMKLADFTAISFTRPLWMPLTAWIVLGEIVGYRRAGFIALGFAGVLVVARPDFHLDAAVMVALLGGALSSLTFALVKQLSTTEPSARIVFYFSASGTVLAAPFAVLDWMTPGLVQLAWLAVAALTAAFSQYCVARACASGDTTVATPVDFLQLPFAALLGFAVFGESPDLWVFVGALLILAAVFGIARLTR